MGTITLMLGGARSGKSAFALSRAMQLPPPRIFVATGVPFDQEMIDRIAKHQAERLTKGFVTIEEPHDLAGTLAKLHGDQTVTTVIVDCLTVWLGNLFHSLSDIALITKQVDDFVAGLDGSRVNLLLVANEVGLGIVPETSLGREFRDVAGQLNQGVAAKADRVFLCVAGIPVPIKESAR